MHKKWFGFVILLVVVAALVILMPYEINLIRRNEVNDVNEEEIVEPEEIAEPDEINERDEVVETEEIDLEDLVIEDAELLAAVEDVVDEVGVETPAERTTLNLTWREETSVAPDQARLILAVETEDEEIEPAYQENNEIVEEVKQALEEYDDLEIETLAFNIYPDRYINQEATRYRVVNRLQLVLSDLDLLAEVIDSAVMAGVNRINSVDFMLSDSREVQSETTAQAIAGLQDKALELTTEFDREEYHFVEIDLQESIQRDRPYLYRDVMMTEQASPGTLPSIEPGDITISTTLRAKIEF